MSEQYNFEKDIDVHSKQIIIDNVDVNALYSDQIACMNRYEVARLFIKTVELLVAKEQECESWKTLIDQAQIEQRKLEQQLEAYKMEAEEGKEINAELKAENEELKRLIAKQKNAKIQLSKLKDKQYKEFCDMKQILTEIKPILEFYANSKMGVDKGNGIFEIEVSNDNFGRLVYCYDTNPAKKALQKISECEVE